MRYWLPEEGVARPSVRLSRESIVLVPSAATIALRGAVLSKTPNDVHRPLPSGLVLVPPQLWSSCSLVSLRICEVVDRRHDLLVPTYWDTYNPTLSVRMATVPSRTKNLIFKITVEHKFPTNELHPVGHGIPNAELLALLNWD